jgi:quinoprotein glucose dehydrogenase
VIESILTPSRTIAPSFGSVTILLHDGQILSGVKTVETPTEVVLVDNQAQKHILPKVHIDQQKPSLQSAMPEELEKRLTEQEFVDLIAFLMSLKASRAP